MRGEENYNSLFVVWWYIEVRQRLFLFAKQFLYYLTDMFSVRICLATLFAPWKRDKVSYTGLAIQDRFQVVLWNMISRLVGAVIKTFTMLAYLVVVLAYLLLGIAGFFLWLLFPLIIIGTIVYGLILVII